MCAFVFFPTPTGRGLPSVQSRVGRAVWELLARSQSDTVRKEFWYKDVCDIDLTSEFDTQTFAALAMAHSTTRKIETRMGRLHVAPGLNILPDTAITFSWTPASEPPSGEMDGVKREKPAAKACSTRNT